jgi:hypothetical protein
MLISETGWPDQGSAFHGPCPARSGDAVLRRHRRLGRARGHRVVPLRRLRRGLEGGRRRRRGRLLGPVGQGRRRRRHASCPKFDEFDIPGLPDASKWDYDTDRNRAGWWNNERQYYGRHGSRTAWSRGQAAHHRAARVLVVAARLGRPGLQLGAAGHAGQGPVDLRLLRDPRQDALRPGHLAGDLDAGRWRRVARRRRDRHHGAPRHGSHARAGHRAHAHHRWQRQRLHRTRARRLHRVPRLPDALDAQRDRPSRARPGRC